MWRDPKHVLREVDIVVLSTSSNHGMDLFLSYVFSLICFMSSFCLSIWFFETLYEQVIRGRRKLRPYSPTLVRLSSQLETSYRNDEAKVSYLADQRLNTAEFAEVVLPMISGNKAGRWKSLDLSLNEISNSGLERLFKTFLHEACNCRLEQIWLKRCGITSITPSLVDYLKDRGSSLKELNLAHNKFSDDGVQRLAMALSQSNLRVLNLSNNAITDVGITFLAEGIVGSGLLELNLRSNKVTDQGINLLASVLDHTRLHSLDVSSNRLSDEGVHILSENIGRLQELYLGDNCEITDASIQFLFRRATTLRVVNLTNLRKISNLSVRAAIAATKYSLLSQVSVLGNSHISPDCADELFQALRFTSSHWFDIVMILCSIHDIPRLGSHRSRFKAIPKDLIRVIASKLINI